MGKITFKKKRHHWSQWEIYSSGLPIRGCWITRRLDDYTYDVEIHSYFFFVLIRETEIFQPQDFFFHLNLANAPDLTEAEKLAEEIFKNKTKLRDRAFESTLKHLSSLYGEDHLTPEVCSDLFHSIQYSLQQRVFQSISD
tara:strand:- start:2962 stop:3381 length:420 start_codon:yes stop_codon:yes gene_type:complete